MLSVNMRTSQQNFLFSSVLPLSPPEKRNLLKIISEAKRIVSIVFILEETSVDHLKKKNIEQKGGLNGVNR